MSNEQLEKLMKDSDSNEYISCFAGETPEARESMKRMRQVLLKHRNVFEADPKDPAQTDELEFDIKRLALVLQRLRKQTSVAPT